MDFTTLNFSLVPFPSSLLTFPFSLSLHTSGIGYPPFIRVHFSIHFTPYSRETLEKTLLEVFIPTMVFAPLNFSLVPFTSSLLPASGIGHPASSLYPFYFEIPHPNKLGIRKDIFIHNKVSSRQSAATRGLCLVIIAVSCSRYILLLALAKYSN